MYTCPLLKEVKNQGKDYRCYRYDNPSLKPPKKVHQVRGGVRNIQVNSVVGLSTPVFIQTGHIYHQDICFDNEFPQSRSTPGTLQAILTFSEISQSSYMRCNAYQLSTEGNVG